MFNSIPRFLLSYPSPESLCGRNNSENLPTHAAKNGDLARELAGLAGKIIDCAQKKLANSIRKSSNLLRKVKVTPQKTVELAQKTAGLGIRKEFRKPS